MKKILIKLILIMSLFLVFNNLKAETCKVDNLKLDSITLVDKSDNTVEFGEAKIENNKIVLDLHFNEKDDYARYKIVINNGNEELEIDKDRLIYNDKYIDYEFETSDNSLTIEENSTKELYLTIRYKNEVPKTLFQSNSYSIDKTLNVDLIGNRITNPLTGDYRTYGLIVLLIISASIIIIIDKKTNSKLAFVLILFAIPITTFSSCKVGFDIDSRVDLSIPNDYDYRYIIPEGVKPEVTYTIQSPTACYEYLNKKYCDKDTGAVDDGKDSGKRGKSDVSNDGVDTNENECHEISRKVCNGEDIDQAIVIERMIIDDEIAPSEYPQLGLTNVSVQYDNCEVAIKSYKYDIATYDVDTNKCKTYLNNKFECNDDPKCESRVSFLCIPQTNNSNSDAEVPISGGKKGDLPISESMQESVENSNKKGMPADSDMSGEAVLILSSDKYPISLTQMLVEKTLTPEEYAECGLSNVVVKATPKDIVIPNEINGCPVTEIGNNAFYIRSLTSVVIPESVEYIGNSAFRGNRLQTITIPKNVKNIDSYAFYNNQLQSVNINGKTSIDDFENSGTNIWGWDSSVTCIKDNEINTENGCIKWEFDPKPSGNL